MALSAKLVMRQGQAMVLTPQLLQAIKLLQMPNAELSAFIENELASNPLLERAEDHEGRQADAVEAPPEAPPAEAGPEPGDWASETFETDRASLEANLGTEVENAFEVDRTQEPSGGGFGEGLPTAIWAGAGGGGREDAPDLEAYVSETPSLQDHLERQAGIMLADPAERMIGAALIDGLDEAGYFTGSIEETAERLGTAL
jgi:RNA polymerase sigma-54 factor